MAQTDSLAVAEPIVRRTAQLLELIFPSPRGFGLQASDPIRMMRPERGS